MGMRVIKFNDKPNRKYAEMINSVVGQLSDGIWENTSGVTGYWTYSNGSKDGTTIELDGQRGGGYEWRGRYKERLYLNPYYNMTDAKVLRYYANKIKQIALIELEDNYYNENIRRLFGNDKFLYYISEEYEKKRVAYDKWKAENPFDRKGKFIPSDTQLIYLNYKENVTMEDAVELYKLLISKANEMENWNIYNKTNI